MKFLKVIAVKKIKKQECTTNIDSHKKGWTSGITKAHVEPSPIPLIKEPYYGKSDKYSVKLKLLRDTTSSTSDLFEFKMSFFKHGEPEEFLLFIHNFNMTLLATGMLETDTNM